MIEGSEPDHDPYLWPTDPGADPGGPKTYKSYGSGCGSWTWADLLNLNPNRIYVNVMLTCSVTQVELERNIMELNEEESYFPVYKKFLINKVETDIVYSSELSLLYTVVCFPYCMQ